MSVKNFTHYQLRWSNHAAALTPTQLARNARTLGRRNAYSPSPGVGDAPGWDDRLDKILAAGMEYQLTEHLSFRAEYEAYLLLNQDSAETNWTLAQNVISEPKTGLTSRFQISAQTSNSNFLNRIPCFRKVTHLCEIDCHHLM
jgi:hypothetical protein